MVDFLKIATRIKKSGGVEIYPKFIIKKSSDLMIRGGDFYAIWLEERGLWSTDEQDVLQLIDYELSEYAKKHINSSFSSRKKAVTLRSNLINQSMETKIERQKLNRIKAVLAETGHTGNGYVRITVVKLAGGAMPYVKVGSAWKEPQSIYVKVGSTWKEGELFVKVNNKWVQ